YANGEVLKDTVKVDNLDTGEETLMLNTEKVNARLGTEISNQEIETILTKLGFTYESSGNDYTLSIPTRRIDVQFLKIWLKKLLEFMGMIIYLIHYLPMLQNQVDYQLLNYLNVKLSII